MLTSKNGNTLFFYVEQSEIFTLALNSENSTEWETLYAARAHAFHNIKRTRFFTSGHCVFNMAIAPLSKQIIVFFLRKHRTDRQNCTFFPSHNDYRYPRVWPCLFLLGQIAMYTNRFKREALYVCYLVAISINNTLATLGQCKWILAKLSHVSSIQEGNSDVKKL